MLKKILASLVLTVGIYHPSIASEITQYPTVLMCVDQKGISEVINQFEEIPFAGGVAMRDIPGVGMVENNMVIFVNPTTKSFTIAERFSKDLYCVLALGEGFRPLSGK
jgi:hypothetical protein